MPTTPISTGTIRRCKGLLLAMLLATSQGVAAADPEVQTTDSRKTYVTSGSFADVREDLELAITGRGIVINNVAHIGNMLSRTAADVGAAVKVYQQAEALEFCSATLSRKMMEADRHNIVFCPYVIAVYTLPDDPQHVFVSYRRPPIIGSEASQQALREVEALLDSLISESLF